MVAWVHPAGPTALLACEHSLRSDDAAVAQNTRLGGSRLPGDRPAVCEPGYAAVIGERCRRITDTADGIAV
ncbi:hypothetical protein TBKG_01412 [Mycobacterium tuberculosis '98-R604 INH-RIF-EM']|nr:hypothetical protein TBKG_01412 [Mycobacterium tuberculosis '98-R604 INH-RIF-EM']